MTAAARSHAVATVTSTPATAPPVLRRGCACGDRAAGPSGRCADCETEARLAPRAGVVVGPADDAFEREAERVAAAVVAGGAAGTIGPPAAPAAQRAPTAASGAPTVAPCALAEATRGGRPLGAALRAEFEPRFGRDLSHLRLHDGPQSQALSRGIGARAATHGHDILFAAGALDESSATGRRLLAHEITHSIQQGAATVLRRAPESESEAGAPGTIAPGQIQMHVIENPTGRTRVIRYIHLEGGRFSFDRTVYPRDTLHVTVECPDAEAPELVGPVAVRFAGAPMFERSDDGASDLELTLRVVAEPEVETEASVFLSAPNVAGDMELALRIGVAPLDIDPVIDARKRKRAERKALRGAQRDARRRLGTERREGDDERDFRAERAALRAEQREERQAFRKGRRVAIDEARDTRKAEVEAARAEHGQFACTASQRQNVEQAMREAIGRLESALAHIRPGEPLDDYRSDALRKCFKLDSAAAMPAELARVQTRAIDVLNIARNSMLVSDPAMVRCGAPEGACKPRAAAFVTDLVRGNPVTVCQIWLDDNLAFEATKLEPGHERAYALIHEFCHLAGVTDQGGETYLHEARWEDISSADALTMADAYASFAWYMSSPGLE